MRLFQLLETSEETYIEAKARDLGLSISVTERNDKIIIHMLKAITPGEGTGSILMKYICAYADQNNKIVLLTPEKIQGTTSVSRLIDFYKRFGFVVNKGKDKDFSISYGMYRLPKSSLTENLSLNLQNVSQFIKNNCQPYLRENPEFEKFPLYRGINKTDAVIISPVRTDRRPLDTDVKTHNAIVKELSKRGIKANRNNSIFCTGDSETPYTYGNKYVIFPVGDFDFTWNPMVEDFTSEISKATTVKKSKDNSIRVANRMYNTICEILDKDVSIINGKISTKDILDAFKEPKNIPEEIFIEIVRNNLAVYNPKLDKSLDSYKTTDLTTAIQSEHEIMIRCKEYVAIKYTGYNMLLDIAKDIKQ